MTQYVKKPGYLGNVNLKPAGVKIEFTKEQVEEYIKCSKDPVYFAKKYVKVVTLDKGVTDFDLYDYQERLVNTLVNNRFVIGKMGRQSGKALSLDTMIPTKNGWTTMGDIQVGDEIFSSNGKLTKVNFKSEIFTDHDCYKIYFDNGEVVTADANHLWKVKNKREKEYILNTLEIFDKYQKIKPNSRGNGFIVGYHIDIQECLELPNQDLPIDPYILGLWLGDGYSSSGRIISHKNDFDEYKNETNFKIKSQRIENNCIVATIEDLHTNLNKLNLLKNKHIPQIYLRSSKEQRLQLLRGLMDTDGSIKKNTRSYEFYQKDSVLVDNFIELISSLGIKCRKRIKIIDNKKYITISFTTSEQVFNLARKLKNVGNDKNIKKANSRINIHKIEKVDSVHTACIQVDDNSHMFLFGNWMIPTHNTTTVGCCYLLHKVLFNQNMSVAILANKLTTARDILGRIREAYEHLPNWLQQGIVEWNKGSIQLENGSKILAAATSSSAIRGGSYNCISGTSIITIKDNLTGEIYNISIEDFYSNSSRNTDYYKNFDDTDGKQMQEMLHFSHQKSKILNRWEVLTADGFKSFRGISKTHNRATIKLVFDNNSELICTEDHKIATNDGFIEAKKLNKNHEVISSNNILHLVDIINHDDSHVYDLLEVTDTHSFFANNILVHNCIFLDEFAFVPTTVAEEFFSSVYPTITAGQSTQMIIISTPKGLNMYYQLYKAAISKQNEYVAFEVDWREVPQYPGGPLRDEAWKEQQIKNTSERQFDAEFNCVSGDTLITIKNQITNEIYTLPISEFYEWVD